MPEQLLWLTEAHAGKSHPNTLAPSWSWVSIDGPVSYRGLPNPLYPEAHITLAQVEHLEVSQSTIDPHIHDHSLR
jgi:hypothetical protein